MKMNKLKKIIVILLFVCILFPKNIYAITQKSAGATLAQFAINFEKNHAEETRYSLSGWSDYQTGDRAMAYKGIKQYKGTNSYYGMDCVGWVGSAIHWSLKLGPDNTFTCFVVPEGDGGQSFSASNGFVEIDKNSPLEPGDILSFWNHVGIYAIDPETKEEVVIHCDGYGRNGSGVNKSNLAEYKKTHPIYHVARISDETAKSINAGNVTVLFGEITGAANGMNDYGKYFGTITGRYTGSYNAGDWLFSKIAGFFDYLAGIITYIIKIPILGYTNIVEALINDFLEEISGPNIEATTDTETEKVEEKLYVPKATDTTWDRVTVEDLIYNNIPILDVNLFSFEQAAGQEINKDSIVYTIRLSIATWYNVIRRISIIILLFILIYLGIQVAINTVAGKRAKYKNMLLAWVTGFIVIFSIHYFMILVINVNQYFVDLFEQVNINAVKEISEVKEDAQDDTEIETQLKGSATIYETIRTRAYSLKMTEGWPATIMYMVLVYYLIKFLFIYFKRYITVNILAVMGPAIGVKYAYDKIKTGKASSLSGWMFDFFINVFLQTIHALLYTVFMIMAFEVAVESIAGFVLALIMMNFMLKAEKIFINIFKFEGKGASLGSTIEDKNYLKEGLQRGITVALFAKGTIGFMFGSAKLVGKIGFGLAEDAANLGGRAVNTIRNRNKLEENKTEFERIDLKEKLLEKLRYEEQLDYLNDRYFGGRNIRLGMHKYKNTDPKLYAAMKKSLAESDKRVVKQWTRTIKKGTKTIGSMAKIFVGIPMSIVDTKEGFLVLTSGVSDLNDLTSVKRRYGYVTKEDRAKRIAGTAATIATAGTFKLSNIVTNELELANKDFKKNAESYEKLNLLSDIAKKEDEIDYLLKEINDEKEKDKANAINDEEKDKKDSDYEKAVKSEIKQAEATVVSSSTIASVVKDYMYEHDVEKLTEKDVENVMKILENMSNADFDKIKIKFGSEVKTNVKNTMKEQLKHANKRSRKSGTVDKKKAVNIIEDAMLKSGSVEHENIQHKDVSENAKVKITELSQKIRELKTLTEKAKNVTGSTQTNMNNYLKGARERSKISKPNSKLRK